MISQTSARGLVGASLLFLGSSSSVFGAGFALIEVNATGQGNAYAGAAAQTENASTIYFNPAGMMRLDTDQLAVALHYIAPSADFNNEGTVTGPLPPGGAFGPGSVTQTGEDDDGGTSAFVPNLYWVKTLDAQTKIGLGVYTPFGLTVDYDDGWVGRYHALFSELKTVNFNPSIGYRVNDKLSVGGGLNLLYAEAELSNAIDFGAFCYAANPGAGGGPGGCDASGLSPSNQGAANSDGELVLTADNGSDISTGFNLGILYEISSQTRIGVSYRSEIDVKVKGEGDFDVPVNPLLGLLVAGSGAFVDTDIDVDVTLPDSFSISLAHEVGKITWLFDITRTGWSSFDELRVEFDNPSQPDGVTTEDWDDSNRYSVGFEYDYAQDLVLRAGVALDETPVPSAERRTPRLPGNDRRWLSLGLTYSINKEMTVDVGYSHLFVKDAETENEFESSVPTLAATLIGEYEADVDILSAQLNWKLD